MGNIGNTHKSVFARTSTTNHFRHTRQLLSCGSGGGVNASPLQSLLLVFFIPSFKMSRKISSLVLLCLAQLAASVLVFRSFTLESAAVTGAGPVHLGGGAFLLGQLSCFSSTNLTLPCRWSSLEIKLNIFVCCTFGSAQQL